jgi:pimeloyl-ACP methyl ester carboxylesterase
MCVAGLRAREQGGPVDLVGHDWGGGHVMRIAMERPDLIRSWAMDIAGCFAPDYVWHDLAQVWQTPGAGEEAVAGMASLPVADRASMFESLGMTPDIAEASRRPRRDHGPLHPLPLPVGGPTGDGSPRRRTRRRRGPPGLVIIPTEDEYTGGEARARWSAQQAKAEVAVLRGLGHWWMIQDPAAGAAALRKFWGSLTPAD